MRSKRISRPAKAYRVDQAVIVEGEDGEIIKRYDIPQPERKHEAVKRDQGYVSGKETRPTQTLENTSCGMDPPADVDDQTAGPSGARPKGEAEEVEDQNSIHFQIDGKTRSVKEEDFIEQIRAFGSKPRANTLDKSSEETEGNAVNLAESANDSSLEDASVAGDQLASNIEPRHSPNTLNAGIARSSKINRNLQSHRRKMSIDEDERLRWA